MAEDMRSYLSALEAAGEVLHIKKAVDPHTELAGLAYQANGQLNKATFFENLTGYPGWQTVSYINGSRKRMALGLGMTPEGFIPEVIKRMEKGLTPCQLVASGPVQEVVWKGNDVDLAKVPIHVHSNIDPGPFIGNMCIVKDPETGRRNLALNRFQIKGKTRMGISLSSNKHNSLIYQRYQKRNEPMPVAVVIGHHPAYYLAGCWAAALGVDELEIAGTLLGKPVELVKCRTIDLEVPAYAELVIEGLVPPDVLEIEGPFGEHAGLSSPPSMRPVMDVTAITMRRDRIYYALQGGLPIAESQILDAMPMEVVIYQRLQEVGGHVDLKDVVAAPYGGGCHIIIVKMTPRMEGQVRNVLLAALSSPYRHPKIAIAVDDDINAHDPKEVMWSLSARVNPQEDVFIIPNTASPSNDLSLPALPTNKVGEKKLRLGSKILIDATRAPLRRPEDRAGLERIIPKGRDDVRLEDYL